MDGHGKPDDNDGSVVDECRKHTGAEHHDKQKPARADVADTLECNQRTAYRTSSLQRVSEHEHGGDCERSCVGEDLEQLAGFRKTADAGQARDQEQNRENNQTGQVQRPPLAHELHEGECDKRKDNSDFPSHDRGENARRLIF